MPSDFGIVIRALPDPPVVSGRLMLHGAFRLPRAIAEIIERPVQRAVVLVVQRFSEFNALTPFRQHILFEGDDELGEDAVGGYFNIDVFQEDGRAVPGQYHLFVSIDEHLSNVIELDVEPE
jgi:hypothetical protein